MKKYNNFKLLPVKYEKKKVEEMAVEFGTKAKSQPLSSKYPTWERMLDGFDELLTTKKGAKPVYGKCYIASVLASGDAIKTIENNWKILIDHYGGDSKKFVAEVIKIADGERFPGVEALLHVTEDKRLIPITDYGFFKDHPEHDFIYTSYMYGGERLKNVKKYAKFSNKDLAISMTFYYKDQGMNTSVDGNKVIFDWSKEGIFSKASVAEDFENIGKDFKVEIEEDFDSDIWTVVIK